MGMLQVTDFTGDKRVQWDPTNSMSVRHARDTYDEYKRKGWLAYKTDKNGQQAEQVLAFEPEAARLIMTPPVVGG